jgi:hypothetical protein
MSIRLTLGDDRPTIKSIVSNNLQTIIAWGRIPMSVQNMLDDPLTSFMYVENYDLIDISYFDPASFISEIRAKRPIATLIYTDRILLEHVIISLLVYAHEVRSTTVIVILSSSLSSNSRAMWHKLGVDYCFHVNVNPLELVSSVNISKRSGIPFTPMEFIVSVPSSFIPIRAGSSDTRKGSVTKISGSDETVYLQAEGFPEGLILSAYPNQQVPPFEFLLITKCLPNVQPGQYHGVLSGTAGGKTKVTSIIVNVFT